MTNRLDALQALDRGERFPYEHLLDPGNNAPAKDWAHKAARGVLADLTDRRGVKHALEAVDSETRKEIVDQLALIIREAAVL